MTQILLPHEWDPRPYQRPAWQALMSGTKRAVLVWHRRSGKDDLALRFISVMAMRQPGTYWHLLPKQAQARKAIWREVNKATGQRRIDEAFPAPLRATTRDNEMQIEFVNGSQYLLAGSDNYDSLVGSAPAGVVFSEYALADPAAWAFIRPILLQNDGWALFISTPRGRNHLCSMFEDYKDDPAWFVQRLTVEDTGVFTPEQLHQERRELRTDYGKAVGEALYRQEYMCAFNAPVLGAYYAEWLEAAEDEGRVCKVPHDPTAGPVHVAFDLGIGDQMALWFAQVAGREVRLLDYYSSMGQGLDHYVGVIRERYGPGHLGRVILPHDATQRSRQTGVSDLDYFRRQGFDTLPVPRTRDVMDDIQRVRQFLPRCVFDREKCSTGLSALRSYRAEYDPEKKELQSKPVHDWASHGADAFRTLVMGLDTADRPQTGMAGPRFRKTGGIV